MEKRLIVIAYREWVFRDDEMELKVVIENLMTTTEISHYNNSAIKFTKRIFNGPITFHYYSPIESKTEIPPLIIADIERDLPHFDNMLILLHNGVGGEKDLSFLNVPADILRKDKLSIEYFSGGSGITYDKLLSASGTIFSELNSFDSETITLSLEEIWDYFKNKSANFSDNFIRGL